MITKYLEKIEFSKIKNILSTYCKTYIGKDNSLNLEPFDNIKDIAKAQKQTSEAVLLLYKKGMPPIDGIANINVHLKRLSDGSSLTICQLLELTKILRIAIDLKKYFSNIDENNVKDNVDLTQFNSLFDLFDHLYTNPNLEHKIEVSILDENTLADTASDKLSKIRKEKRSKEQEIRNKLNSFLSSKYIQDPVITIRAGRFVVPIKNEYRSEVKGFIHDISSSGSTVFIEPLSVFELNNDLNTLNLEEIAEIEKILQILSSLFFDLTSELENNVNLIGLLDFIFAKAKYSKDLDFSEPIISERKEVSLLQAWHPLIDKQLAVKNDIHLGKDYTSLIITGPNTGGKTVTLKTIGLLNLMGMCGMHIPAKEGSQIAIFDNIFTDIGDEQSIADSLSTFSSHMTNIADILAKATDNSLVLLDELGSGTDPIQGAKLAISILEDLHSRHALTVATTHYSELKEYVLVTDGFENASVEFDIDTLTPTFKLLLGVPGSSNAFAISEKLGIPKYVVDNAKSMMDNTQVNIDDLLNSIYSNKREIDKQLNELKEKNAEIDNLKNKLKTNHSDLKKQEQEILEKAKQEARDILLDAKEEANDIVKEAQSNGNSKEFNQARMNINKKINDLKAKNSKIDSDSIITEKDVKIGMPVFIPSLNQVGNIISTPNKDNLVSVQVGIIKMNFKLNELEKTEEQATNTNNKFNYSKEHKMHIQTVSSEINVIGQNIEEANFVIDKYLDNATRAGLHECRIVHGKGTGALRAGIHKFLKTHPHVANFRVGTYGEGEMGVTIVELK